MLMLVLSKAPHKFSIYSNVNFVQDFYVTLYVVLIITLFVLEFNK